MGKTKSKSSYLDQELFYERSITQNCPEFALRDLGVQEVNVRPHYSFKRTGSKDDLASERRYKLFCAYLKKKQEEGIETEEGLLYEEFVDEERQSNYAIQDVSDGEQSFEFRDTLDERSEQRNSERIRNGSEIKKKGPTPFTTMYYNDPNYAEGNSNRNTNTSTTLSVPISNNASRIGNNGLVSSASDQQSKNSLIQNVVSDSNELHHSRPATKDDFVIHQVKISDTLERISIQYDVSKDAIRMANGFLGEEVYMHKTLRIPFTYGEIYHVPEDKNDQERKLQWAQETFHQTIRDVNRNNENYSAEVKFYLEITNFDMTKAMELYEEDMKFEKQVVKDNKKYITFKRKKRLDNIGCSCFYLCFFG